MQEVIPSVGDVVIVLHIVDSPHGSQLCCMESQRLLIKGNLERNHSWESDGRDSN